MLHLTIEYNGEIHFIHGDNQTIMDAFMLLAIGQFNYTLISLS